MANTVDQDQYMRDTLDSADYEKWKKNGQLGTYNTMTKINGANPSGDYSAYAMPTTSGVGMSKEDAIAFEKSSGINDTLKASGTSLKDALTSSGTVNNSSMINDSYSNLTSALRDKIQQQQNNKQLEIDKLGQTYQPQRNQSEVQKNNELRSVLEQNANAGDRGGVGRQNALETQTAADNRLNAINLQQTNDETNLKNDIANLLLEGNIQEAQLKSQQLKDVLSENIRADEVNYSRSRDSVADSRYDSETAYNHGRDSLSDAINADNTAYSRSRDKVGDTRYADETAYNRSRDAKADAANADNTAYSRLRDQISDTGKLPDGTYTQSGKINSQNIAMNDAEYKEKTDPNSTTNQLAKIGLDTAKVNYAILDQTSKAQVDSILLDVTSKKISNETAQYELDELTNPLSVTNQTKQIQLDTYKQDYVQQQKVNAEWVKFAPYRIATAKQEALQATSATQLAKLQVKVANEELLAKQIEVKNMTQQQKDIHNKALQDIADSKASISQRAQQLGISQGELQLQRDKFAYDKTQTKQSNPTTKELTVKQDADLRAKAAQMATTQEGTFDAGVADTIYKYLKGQATGTTTSNNDLDAMRKAGLIK